MNKLFKKLFVLLLALTVAFAAVGCDSCNQEGSGEGSGNGPYVPDTSILQPPTPEISMKATNDLVVGDEVYLKPTLKNVKGDLAWSSSDPSVATVDSTGIVRAISEGTATVTASYSGVSATSTINVSYGNFIPNIATYSGLDVMKDDVVNVLAVGNSYQLGAYIDFNNHSFNDTTFTYESSDEEVLEIDENGNVNPKKFGEDVTITVKANWRNKFNIVKTFNVYVRENVLFYVDGDILQNIVVETPAVYYGSDYTGHVIELNPSVIAGKNATVDNNVLVNIVPMDNTVADVDYTYDSASKVYTANALGKSLVNMSYEFEGSNYLASFIIEAVRPVKEITAPVDYYSAGIGTYKVKDGDSYIDKTLVDYAWGESADVTLFDAYQEGTALTVKGEIVEGLVTNFDDYTTTAVTIGTKTECYTVYLNKAAAYYMSNANDVVTALDKTDKAYSPAGLYVLMNDVDLAGAPAIRNYNVTTSFHGIFEGNGYTISNPVVEMKSNKNSGLFGPLQSGCAIRNLALINVNSINVFDTKTGKYTNLPNNGWMSATYSGSGATSLVLENLYIQTGEEMRNHAGMFVKFPGTAKNVIINEKTPAGFSVEEWFKDFNNTYYGSGQVARTSSEFIEGKKINGLYVISQKPVHYSQTKSTSTYEKFELFEPSYDDEFKIALNDKGNKIWNDETTYAENETELWYVYDYFTNATTIGGLGLKNPTVQDVIKAMGGNGKISVANNLRRYDSYTSLSLDEDEKHVKNLGTFNAAYWTVVNGIPVWNSIAQNPALHDDFFGITLGGKDATYGAAVKSLSEYELALSTLNNDLVSELTFSVEGNPYVTIDGNVLKATKETLTEIVTVTANFKYNGVAKSLSMNVQVVSPFDVTVGGNIAQNYEEYDLDGEYQLGISFNGTVIENVTYASSNADVIALKDGSTDTFITKEMGEAVITATFTHNEVAQTRDFYVNVVDPIMRASVLVDGKANSTGVIKLNAYDDAELTINIDGTVYGASAISLTSANETVVDTEGNVISALKYVQGASVELEGKFTIANKVLGGNREYPMYIVVEIQNPFKLAINNEAVDVTKVKELDLYNEYDLSVLVNNAKVETVQFTSSASNVAIENGKLTVNALGDDATIVATYTYGANENEVIELPVKFIDSVLAKSVVTVNGEVLEGDVINVVMPDGTATIGVNCENAQVTSVTLTGFDGFATLDGTKLTPTTYGAFDLTITYVVDGKNHVKVVPVSFAYPSITIESAIDYDASNGLFRATSIEGNIFSVKVGEELLTVDNEGLVINGDIITLRAKTSEKDDKAGVPYIWNKDTANNKLTVEVNTDVNTYVFTNVYYYTKLISDITSLKAALGAGVDYSVVSGTAQVDSDRDTNLNGNGFMTVDSVNNGSYREGVYNVGIYKLTNDIDMNKTGIGYTNNPNPTINGGFAGMFDGDGYSIINYAPGTNGLFGSMNTYIYGHEVNYAFGSGSNGSRCVPALPTIKNVAFENVITSVATPVIAATTGQPENYQGRDVTIENIYVTVSSESTGFVGIVKKVNRATVTNNVLVVDNNEYDTLITLDNSYRIAERDGVTIDPSKKYVTTHKTTEYTNVGLFGRLGDINLRVQGVVENTTNVYVVSQHPVMFYDGVLATWWYTHLVHGDAENSTAHMRYTFNQGYNATTRIQKIRAYGYASNETQGNILVPYAIRPNLLAQLAEDYTKNKVSYDSTGYFCPVCGEVTLAFGNGTLEGTTCTLTENCQGQLIKNHKMVTNGIWTSPVAYEWTVHNLATDAGYDFTDDNGAFKFAGVRKFASVADMKADANNNFDSFVGEDGNGMWKVEAGELIWVGAQA